MSSAHRRSSSKHSALPIMMRQSILYLLILLFTFKVSATRTEQESNDFIFEDQNLQEISKQTNLHSTSSREDSRRSTVPIVFDNSQSNDEDNPIDHTLFGRVDKFIQRFKRQAFWSDWLPTLTEDPKDQGKSTEASSSLPPASSSVKTSSAAAATLGRTRRAPQTTGNENDSSDSEEDNDENDPSSSTGGDVYPTPDDGSGGGPAPPIEEPSEKMYFRVVIKLLVPYTRELADHESVKFIEYSTAITSAIDEIFKASVSVGSRVAAIINTADKRASKAIIELELTGKDGPDEVESKIATHLGTYLSLNSAPATAENLNVNKIEGIMPKPCNDSKIPCLLDTQMCYASEKRCNGAPDCLDNTDEEDCPSGTTELPTQTPDPNCGGDLDTFECQPNLARKSFRICGHQVCDQILDCPGGEDELNCPTNCSDSEFLCSVNKKPCIPLSKRCDGVVDCPDSTDEFECGNPASCKPFIEFSCPAAPASCYPSYLRCDNTAQCNDKSDEEKCVRKGECPPTQLKCYDGTCIPASSRCDKKLDCSTGEDELDCQPRPSDTPNIATTITPAPGPAPTQSTCAPGEFRCSSGFCIESRYHCDGYNDCPDDNSDEAFCAPTPRPCSGPGEFRCGNGQCISVAKRCDKVSDCQDQSDEEGCTVCNENEFVCDGQRCVSYSGRCDRKADCVDGTDEAGCENFYTTTTTTTTPPPSTDRPFITPNTSDFFSCRPEEFTCRVRFQCVRGLYRCDGRQDCYDNTDETDCEPDGRNELNLRVIPIEQIIKESQEVVFQCRDEGPLRLPIFWERANGVPLPPNARVIGGRLEIPDIQLNQAGIYVCRVADEYRKLPGSQVPVRLTVEPFVRPQTVPPRPLCRPDQATCHTGGCIARNLICNGQKDCDDGSDELRCNLRCEPNEFRCRNGKCVSKTWRCDSEDDCSDGSDEENCEPAPPGSRCRYDEFACTNSTQCIPKSMQCDSEIDCNDSTDEIGCSKVVVITPPVSSVTLPKGEVFQITCRTVGTPTPEVIWRLNWGHVPAKCRTTSVDGFGTLTCPNIQPEDQGAYSCEAINSKGSVFANVDTILIVETYTIFEPPCPAGQLSLTPGVCVDCYCSGATTDCKSANLFKYHLLPPPNSQFRIVNVHFDRRFRDRVEIRGNEISDRSFQVQMISSDRFRVRGVISEEVNLGNIFPYLALPDVYLGNQLKSYGGNITFKMRYENDGPPQHSPYIILSGDGKQLTYGLLSFSIPGVENVINVQLIEGQWNHQDERSALLIKDRKATRQELLSVLANLEYVLLKTQWNTNRNIDVTFSEFRFDTATNSDYGLGPAPFVEKCACPAGYTGLSCESCEPGYSRNRSSSEYGTCQVDWIKCPYGSFGDPSRGVPCRPCACPFANSDNLNVGCFLDTDGRQTCNCPSGYEGRNCERCSPGYNGNPLVAGSSCERTPCDPAGSASTYLNPASRSCTCKRNVFGPYCRQCKAGTFYLHPANQDGCISCFCMGASTECQSSALYRQHIRASFVDSTEEFKIALRKDLSASPISEILVNQPEQEIVYHPDYRNSAGVLYWILPQKFLGDKLTSYGGVLNYTLRFTPSAGSPRNDEPDVEIYSSTRHVRLLYFRRGNPLQPDTRETVTVPLREQYWEREDRQIVDREHFLMTLSHVTMIIIKASYTTATDEVALQSVVMDTAEERNTGLSRAYEVEECRCPEGHEGLSCQQCSPGYYRTENLYLGLCRRCDCNGHSAECDPETGYCLNCAANTTGAKCQDCETGYVKVSGGGCIPVANNISAKCDSRGVIEPSRADDFGQCNCKENVMGPLCDVCRPGTFDLQASRKSGCLECYCSGVSRQCHSSSFFVTQLPCSILLDNPGFTLTDSNKNVIIDTGFKLNADKNEIQFNYPPERGSRLYWSLPSQFTGNKITSYGGKLSWTQGFDAPRDHIFERDNDLIIKGDGISLFWIKSIPINANQATPISVKLEEDSFKKVTDVGEQIATRRDLLRVLSNIEAILIRAMHATPSTSVYLSDVVLDIAVNERVSGVQATQVESCSCPPGYKGTSCEVCDRGFYDAGNKQCRRCPCNGREESCQADASSKVFCNCQPGYTGEFCEERLGNNGQNPNVTPSTITITIREPLIQIVAVGSTVSYTCRATSRLNRPVTLFWTKEGGSLPAGRATYDPSGNLVLMNVEPSDSGIYVCKAADGASYAHQEVNITVGDTRPRVILSSVQDGQESVIVSSTVWEVVAGQLLNIKCEATGTPLPTVEWLRPGVVSTRRSAGIGVVSYIVTPVTKRDEGTYYCRASNPYGSTTSTIVIRVREDVPTVPTVRVSIQPSSVGAVIGETIRLQCTSDPSFGYRFEWSRVPNLPFPQKAKQDNERGELTIYDAVPADSGQYVCNVINEVTRAVVGQSEAYVTIANEQEPGRPPRLTIEPEDQKVAQGSKTMIRCDSSDPRARIVWSKTNEDISNAPDILIRGSELVILSAQIKHRGNYKCSATNAHGTDIRYARLEVDRREAPAVRIYPEDRQPIAEGDTRIFQCNAYEGIPTPYVRWRRAGDLPFSNRVEDVNGVLRLTQVTAEDEGEYICSANNTAGRVEAVLNIVIASLPKIVVPRSPLVYSVGQYVRIECRAEGRPAPSVYWKSQSLPVSSRVGNSVSGEHSAILEITAASMSDTGVYTCVASNLAGTVEDQVQVIVNRPSRPSVPNVNGQTTFVPSLPPDGEVAFPMGSRAVLRCDVGSQSEPVYLYWKREGKVPLSDYRDERNGSLIIYDVKATDAGKYSCIGVGDRGSVLFSKTINLIIIAPPQIQLSPLTQVRRPGDDAYVMCTATGDQPITIYWSSVGNNQLPKSVSVNRGLLQFRGLSVNDAGKYVCRAENMAGKAESVAEVIVTDVASQPNKPTIRAVEAIQSAFEGADATLKCNVISAVPNYQIKWSRENSVFGLPRRAQPQGDTLHLFGVTIDDRGRYTCEVHSPYGVSSDSIELFIERTCLSDEFRCNDGTCIISSQLCDNNRDCPDNSDESNCHYHRRGINKTLDNEITDYHINAGEPFRLPCSLSGTWGQDVEGHWSKIDGSFDLNVKTIGNTLSINDAVVSNSGTYRCTVFTNTGEEFKDYSLKVESMIPQQLSVDLLVKTVQYGDDIDLTCNIQPSEPANYSWTVHTQNKALRKIIPDKKVITVNNATVSNSGLYFCNINSEGRTYKLPTMLLIEDVIPAFKETSYVTFPPLTQATMSFDIKIKFKPERSEGLILYSVQSKDGKGDFLAFGLQNGYPELKFDMGSKPFTIRGEQPLKLNEWNTVRLIRDGREGVIEIDETYNYTAQYNGRHMTLDLPLPLWVGGVSNYAVTKHLGYSVGLTGCIGSLVINGKSYDLRRDALRSNELTSCNSCERNECQNRAGCQESPSSNTGYVCICPPGYSGEHCYIRSETCYLDTCGSGQCLEMENGSGVECQCPMGTSGPRCQEKISIDIPAFTRNSYLSYSTPLLMKNKFEFSLMVKPVGETQVDDGIILYVAENREGLGDYVAVSIVNGYVQLTGRIVSKPINILSDVYLTPLKNVTISASLDASNAELVVDGETKVEEFNPTNELFNQLKLHTPLYIGGYDKKSIILPEDIRGKSGLNGCVSSVKLSGMEIKHVQTHTDSANVQDCKTIFGDVCEKGNPCQNNGSCVAHGVRTHSCVCKENYGGQNCERLKNICEKLNPCRNDGECQVTGSDSYICSCPLGFMGSVCGETTTIENAVSFAGNGGYVELKSSMLPHETEENILITFVTKSANGLLFWQGGNKTVLESSDDFIAISIQNGYVQMSYRVKSQWKEFKASNHKVDDGRPHSVIVRLDPKKISVELDDQFTDFRYIEEPHVLRTNGNIYIGGLPRIRFMTKNMFRETFNGCVQTVKFNNGQAINFGSKAISASNAAPCAMGADTNEVRGN